MRWEGVGGRGEMKCAAAGAAVQPLSGIVLVNNREVILEMKQLSGSKMNTRLFMAMSLACL